MNRQIEKGEREGAVARPLDTRRLTCTQHASRNEAHRANEHRVELDGEGSRLLVLLELIFHLRLLLLCKSVRADFAFGLLHRRQGLGGDLDYWLGGAIAGTVATAIDLIIVQVCGECL